MKKMETKMSETVKTPKVVKSTEEAKKLLKKLSECKIKENTSKAKTKRDY